jgi:hypothetical protein
MGNKYQNIININYVLNSQTNFNVLPQIAKDDDENFRWGLLNVSPIEDRSEKQNTVE